MRMYMTLIMTQEAACRPDAFPAAVADADELHECREGYLHRQEAHGWSLEAGWLSSRPQLCP